jgi:hypothetical protein
MASKFFGVCPIDGNIEWAELSEERDTDKTTRINYLKKDGSVAYKNKYVRLRNKEYLDIVCSICEAPVILIPFEVCLEEERIKVFEMSHEERIKFAERFELLDSLD